MADAEGWNDLFRDTPGLFGLRLFYAGLLHRGRLRFVENPDQDAPLAYSGLSLDLAQQHYEEVFDHSDPRRQISVLALYQLGDVALRMGDYPASTLAFSRIAKARVRPIP